MNREISDPTTKRARRRKVAAVLAGGLVLGVGTMATLASWNDSEFANATFMAGTFALAGSTTGANFTDHTVTPALLPFVAPFRNMQPGSDSYAPFAVQLTAATTNDATVTISATSSDTVDGLTYGLVMTPSIVCDETAFNAAVASNNILVPAGALVGTATNAQTFDLTKAAGSTVFMCYKVSATTDLTQGQIGTGTWQFEALSKAS